MENTETKPETTAHKSKGLIQEGDLVLLWFEGETSYMVEVQTGKKLGIHCGRPLDTGRWIGKPYGIKVKCSHEEGYLLKPSLEDLMMKASRESGIIYPKDAAFLIIRGGIESGCKVLEIGTGSGSLTMALAKQVMPSGKVHTFDRREDLPKNAVKNITRAGLKDYVVFHQRVSGEALPEKDFDAAILDIPTPWEEVDVVWDALRGGARIISLNPTFNQIEKMAAAMQRKGFLNIQAVELLERPILAREGKTRPVQRMVSHTEFMLFAIRPSEEILDVSQNPPAPAEFKPE